MTIGTSVIIITKKEELANTLESYLDLQHVSCGIVPVDELFRLGFLENEVVQLSVKLIIADLESYSKYREEFQHFIEKHPVHPPLILIAEPDEVELAVQATHEQAFHYLVNPIKKLDFNLAIDRALHFREILGQNLVLRRELKNSRSVGHIIGKSPAMQEVFDLIQRVAHTSANILIQGESGTGKELVARAIHELGSRSKKPFVAINCTAIPEGLLESELFGHKKGSFTGATHNTQGLFKAADGGTLFLDEINSLPLAIQAKLLRFLDSGEYLAIGDVHIHKVNVRIIAATNSDLTTQIKNGEFRADLYYRLNVVPLELPSLATRNHDIELLSTHFFKLFEKDHDIKSPKLSKASLKVLKQYHWPGNIRELRNLCERLSILYAEKTIEPENLPNEFRSNIPEVESQDFTLPSSGVNLETLEANLILQALDRTQGNRSKSAKLLGISRDTLLYRMQKHGFFTSL